MAKVGHLSLMCFQAKESTTFHTRPFVLVPSLCQVNIVPMICTYTSIVTLELVESVEGPSVE
jgi:hypothetical protein